jgi:hypothetical protein
MKGENNMKDIIRIGFFVAVEEPSGKTAKMIGKVLEKYEPQITRVVEAFTKFAEDEIEKPLEKK